MNENGGKGLFYGVIGVATLIVAIIGATFAWFTATDGQDAAETIVTTGTLTIEYTDGSTLVAENLKPSTVAQVNAAYTSGQCVHAGEEAFTSNEKVCSVYEFHVENTGSLYADLTATMSGFGVSAVSGELAEGVATDTDKNFKYAVTTTAPGAAAGLTAADLADASAITLNPSRLAPGAKTDAYIVVWLDSAAGNDYQNVKATAQVTVNAAQTNAG